jgi:PII-like signaling protein
MTTSLLRFYVREGQRCQGRPFWEWLLAEANRMGLRGGSAFRAMAGFGRHHRLHENHFFELAGSLTIEVEFVVDDDEASRLLALIEAQGLRVPYARLPATLGVLNPDAGD